MRSPKAIFNAMGISTKKCFLGSKLTDIAAQVMMRSNCLSKVVNVMARLLKCFFGMDRSKIEEELTVTDIKAASMVLFIASMEPTLIAFEAGKLDSLRPIVDKGIVYARGRCEGSMLQLFGIDKLPILARESRLAELIMLEAHCEGHRSLSSDVLARSKQRAWIIRGRHLAKTV